MARSTPRPLSARRVPGQPLIFLVTVVLLWTSARVIHHLQPAEAGMSRALIAQPRFPDLVQAPVVQSPIPRRSGMMALLGLEARAAVRGVDSLQGHRQRQREVSARAIPDIEASLALHRMWIETLTSSGGPTAPGAISSPLVDRPLFADERLAGAGAGAGAGVWGAGVGTGGTLAAMQPGRRRLSVYGWSLLRQGSNQRVLAPGGQYGGSQAGLVLQLALGTAQTAPVLYARATTALASDDDRTLAIGLSARPFASLPVDLAVERRFGLARGQSDNFAAMLVGGASASERRSGVRIDGYAQAGIVGFGDPRGFFDLQMVALRSIAADDRPTVSVGAGLWAGGQQNIDADGDKSWLHRVDIGPRAALAVPVADGQMTLALDWRQRVDGRAQPASGAALTLSAGF